MAETIKERQARLKEAREHRRIRIGKEHKYIFEIVGAKVDMEPSTIEEFILDTEQQIELMDQFLAKNDGRKLMFYYQECDPPSHDSGRAMNVPKGTKIPTVFITNGFEEGLTGRCIFFLRTNINIPITMRNLHEIQTLGFHSSETLQTVYNPKWLHEIMEEIFYGCIELPSGSACILEAIKKTMTLIYKPSINAIDNWGEMTETPQGKKMRRSFIESFDGFIQFLDGKSYLVPSLVI
ncbi:dynein axonemal heavy chain 8-like [Saccoglossus kowalevskii]